MTAPQRAWTIKELNDLLDRAQERSLSRNRAGYVYRGRNRDLGLDLEAANAAILAARDPNAPQRPVDNWTWPEAAERDPERVAAGRAGGQARAARTVKAPK